MEPSESQPTKACHVVAMPYPGRGHINPMMNLCELLVRRNANLHVTFVVTEEWAGLLGSHPIPDRIRLATLPNVIPSEFVRADDFIGFIDAVFTKLEEPFDRLLDGLGSPPPAVIIADTYVVWAVAVGHRRNIPVASLWTMSGTILSLFLHSDLLASHGHFPVELPESRDEDIVDYIPALPPTRLSDLPTIYQGYSHRVFNRAQMCFDELFKADYLLFTSFYEFEPKAFDVLTSKFPFPVYAIGPSIPFTRLACGDVTGGDSEYLRWLDQQPKSSVLYISQGSFLSGSKAQMEEIIAGVKESGVRFIWVARGDAPRLKEALGDVRGLVVSWCDQLRVLCHAAVGGFWTHCGFNSTLEGTYAGVPMLVFPLFWDQLLNGKMIVEDWKIGMRIMEKKREDLIKRDEIKEIVKRFMDYENEEGTEMRRRVRELSEICRGAIAEGGSSDANINAFLREITKTP